MFVFCFRDIECMETPLVLEPDVENRALFHGDKLMSLQSIVSGSAI